MRFDIDSSNGLHFSANNLWWILLGYCSEYIAPSITASCRYWDESGSNGLGDGDGLDADHAHKLGGALQCALDNGSIDKLARELFVMLYQTFGRYVITSHQSLPWLERKYVNEFVSEVNRWIEFLVRCDGFTISRNDDKRTTSMVLMPVFGATGMLDLDQLTARLDACCRTATNGNSWVEDDSGS